MDAIQQPMKSSGCPAFVWCEKDESGWQIGLPLQDAINDPDVSYDATKGTYIYHRPTTGD